MEKTALYLSTNPPRFVIYRENCRLSIANITKAGHRSHTTVRFNAKRRKRMRSFVTVKEKKERVLSSVRDRLPSFNVFPRCFVRIQLCTTNDGE